MTRVTILNKGRTIDVPTGKTILEAAIDAGIDYPFGCHSGLCGACKSRVVTGAVRMQPCSELALPHADRDAGLVLACRAEPVDFCVVVYDDDPEAPQHQVRTMETLVAEAIPATHDIVILKLSLPAGIRPLAFSAGQFARLSFPGAPSRDYSMASRPDETALAFHIRWVVGGAASGIAHDPAIIGAKVVLQGPFGTSYLRERHDGPILAVAGGSGLAPILSIVETALSQGRDRPIRLYFGVREERDLYLLERLDALAASHANFSYLPVLSHTRGPTDRRTGYLADILEADLGPLAGWKAYLAGPPIMAETVTRVLQARGLGIGDIHADPFYTAADRPAEPA